MDKSEQSMSRKELLACLESIKNHVFYYETNAAHAELEILMNRIRSVQYIKTCGSILQAARKDYKENE